MGAKGKSTSVPVTAKVVEGPGGKTQTATEAAKDGNHTSIVDSVAKIVKKQ